MYFMNSRARKQLAFLALTIFGLAGCASTIETFSEHDESVRFDDYQTFAWISEHPMVSSPRGAAATSPFTERRIQDAIRHELTSRGYQLVQSDEDADFVISFSVGGRREVGVESYPVAYRHRWNWGSAYIGDSLSVESNTEGVLAIDLFDTRTKSPIWHGVASKNLSEAEQDLRGSIIEDAVSAILAEFPPPQQ